MAGTARDADARMNLIVIMAKSRKRFVAPEEGLIIVVAFGVECARGQAGDVHAFGAQVTTG